MLFVIFLNCLCNIRCLLFRRKLIFNTENATIKAISNHDYNCNNNPSLFIIAFTWLLIMSVGITVLIMVIIPLILMLLMLILSTLVVIILLCVRVIWFRLLNGFPNLYIPSHLREEVDHNYYNISLVNRTPIK